MQEEFIRTEMIIGTENLKKLSDANVAIFGVGGVGGYVAEGIARCGVSKITLIDNDVVSVSNINRQIVALYSTIGKHKTEVMKERISDINKNADVTIVNDFYNAENKDCFEYEKYDYIVDAIDTVSSKILLVEAAKKYNIPIISSMGAGNKLTPTMFEVADIHKTSVCPLARVMRRELKNRGIKKLKVVYSKEETITPEIDDKNNLPIHKNRVAPGSISFVPSVVGLIIASEVIKDLISVDK